MVSNIKLHSQKVAYKNSKMTLILSVAFCLAMLSFLPAFPALPCHCDTKYQETLSRAEQQQGAAPTAPEVWVEYLSYNTPGFSSFVTVNNGLIQMSTILSSVIGNEGFPTVWVYWSKHDFRLLNKNLVLVLASLISTSHNLESFEKGNLPWENTSTSSARVKACVTFSCLRIEVGGSNMLWAVPLLGLWSWVLLESKLSKPWKASQKAILLYGLCISSCFWVPALISLDDRQAISRNKPSPFQVAFGYGVL